MFADYEPNKRSRGVRSPAGYAIRPLSDADLHQYSAILTARQGITPEAGLAWAQKDADRMRADPERHRILVALANERVIGFGKVVYFTPPENAPPNAAPAGWHLGGVVVRPSDRRRGVASALIAARLTWIEEREPVAWYFANERNRATIDLHAPFGFREQTRDFWVPGINFSGGSTGVLFRANAPWRA